MELIITILPVVTKDLPISRLTIFYRDASSALLQLVNQWLNAIITIVLLYSIVMYTDKLCTTTYLMT